MEFTNQEIIKFLVNPLKKYPQLDIRFLSAEHKEISEKTTEQIKYVVLDGYKEDFHLGFYGDLTTFFTPAESEEIIFIDDRIKRTFTESDLYDNILYEGILYDKTNKEILELLLQFVEVFIGATKVEVSETKVTDKKDKNSFFKIDFIIKVFNETGEKKQITIENITFIVNGD